MLYHPPSISADSPHMAKFTDRPIEWVFDTYSERGRWGVWHFTPTDWDTICARADMIPQIHKLLGLDVLVYADAGSPPQLRQREQ